MTVKLEDIKRINPSAPEFLLPVIKMRIRGNDHYFIIDTGCEGTMLSPELVESVFSSKVNVVGTMGGFGAGGLKETIVTPIVACQFRMLGVEIDRVTASFDLFKALLRETGVKFSGLIGQDFLRKFKSYSFDNERKEFTVNV